MLLWNNNGFDMYKGSNNIPVYRMFDIPDDDIALFMSLVNYLVVDKSKEINIEILKDYASAEDYPHKNELIAISSFYGSDKTFSLLLKNKANPRVYGDLSLRLASEGGHLKLVKKLVKGGSNVAAMDNFALRISVVKNKVDVVDYLLKNGADIHVMGGQAFVLASELPSGDMIALLNKYNYDKKLVSVKKTNNNFKI